VKKDWFKIWFESDYYQQAYNHRDENDAKVLCELILNSVQLHPKAKILDAACGAGRHYINFAQKGFSVFGFDLSKNLLNVAKRNCELKNIQANFFCADIRKVFLKSKFDLITNLFTSFGYFESDKENFSFIQNAYELLKENGYYVLDYFNENHLRKNLLEKSYKKNNEVVFFENRKIINGRIEKIIKIKNPESEIEFIESVKIYSFEQLKTEITKIGFELVKTFGNYSGEKFDIENSQRLIMIFKK